MAEETFTKIGHFKSVADFQAHLAGLGSDLPCDERILSAADGSPMGQAIDVGDERSGPAVVGNRWCVHPMEGWDGTADGQPTEHTLRRWQHFGESGAKLIWGGEAFAVQGDGRANPNQIGVIDDDVPRAQEGAAALLRRLTDAHREKFGRTDDLLVGLQLTHSGRFCRPRDKKKLEPKIAYHHPILDKKFHVAADDPSVVVGDDYVERLVANYARAARLAQRAGFGFVDVKHCHGYLGHEFLSAHTRPGKYGGDFAGRTRFAREIVEAIRAQCPGLMIGVRLSAFDHPPFKPDPDRSQGDRLGPGIPEEFTPFLPYHYGFGCNPNNPLQIDLAEPIAFVRLLRSWGVRLVNVSCASPYYNPHFMRPAAFPPSDGYLPPEDPLAGVARQVHAVREIKAACPDSVVVGAGYSYLQEYLPHVAQAVVRRGWADFAGVGRLVLSYWDMPADTLAGREFQAKRLCRTFSDCTTAPRNGIVSGCFPLDPYYKDAPEHAALKQKKAELRKALNVLQTRDAKGGVPG